MLRLGRFVELYRIITVFLTYSFPRYLRFIVVIRKSLFAPRVFVAALLALTGLWIYEDVWVKAGQSIPLS